MTRGIHFRMLLALKRAYSVIRILLFGQGYLRSVLRGRPVDGGGRPLPWFTYPAIEYLQQFDFSERAVFEYGAGNSSLYWAARAQRVVSVESSEQWYQYVAGIAPRNLELLLEPEREGYVSAIRKQAHKFDVIVLDGRWRNACAAACEPCLADGGMIIIDNSDRHYRACDELREKGYFQIDFSGFCPANTHTSTTSLFIRMPVTQQGNFTCPQPVGGAGNVAGDDG